MSLPVCYRMVCIIISVLDIAQLPYTSPIYYLVGGLEHLDYFPYIGNVIIPDYNHIIIYNQQSYTGWWF
jgi:hypothetical protein